MNMAFFDGFLPIGRTNQGLPESPATEAEALSLMDRWWVEEALVYHTVARDSDPELGNSAISTIQSDRLHKIWGFDPTFVIPESPVDFLKRALAAKVKAVMINPLMRGIRVDRSLRLLELAALLEARRIPLIVSYRESVGRQDLIDWYDLADFCNKFPKLPVISWEWRSRSNRPMFDALAQTNNLKISLASIWQAQMVDQLCDAFGPDRLIFSLGLPNLDPATFHGVVSYANISPSAKEAIAGGTLRTLLSEADYNEK